ncbi:rhodanese-like domain-containing protein [Azospirillum halopraeferens]|uniref:rhodanese-like domain-containing protein n=1 Tax=Azospirillum halopraeferens TaxID=34010 RepID=UPI0003F83073|nr:rhodanese-like domain-containing protein [Azospirillum halopraeferens]
MDDTVLTVALVGAAALVMLWPMIRMRLAGVGRVGASEVKGRLDRGDDLLLLDVRSAGEFAGGHIAGAVNVPLDTLDRRLAELREGIAAHRSAAVVVVCQTGPRAARASAMLKRAGLADVSVLQGGMSGWSASGLPVSGPRAGR